MCKLHFENKINHEYFTFRLYLPPPKNPTPMSKSSNLKIGFSASGAALIY